MRETVEKMKLKILELTFEFPFFYLPPSSPLPVNFHSEYFSDVLV